MATAVPVRKRVPNDLWTSALPVYRTVVERGGIDPVQVIPQLRQAYAAAALRPLIRPCLSWADVTPHL
jgi:hypothetical protein